MRNVVKLPPATYADIDAYVPYIQKIYRNGWILFRMSGAVPPTGYLYTDDNGAVQWASNEDFEKILALDEKSKTLPSHDEDCVPCLPKRFARWLQRLIYP